MPLLLCVSRLRHLCVGAVSLLGFALQAVAEAPARADIPDRVFVAAELGVKPGLERPVTSELQKAIDHVAAAGGGRLVLGRGTYVTGPLTLASHLDFQIGEGATLRLLPREPSYPQNDRAYLSLLSAVGASDLRISGPGRIDGQGPSWWRAYRAKELTLRRPQIILLERCERVELDGFNSINPPNTHVALRLCRDVTIRDVVLEAPDDSPNTDGLNLSGKNYLIAGCRISTGDDNIVVLTPSAKDWAPPVCENFVIRDCFLGFGHGLSIGSYTGGGIRNLLAERITFDATSSGIRLKASRDRGGLVENLTYRDLTMRGVKNPVFISSYYPKEPRSPDLEVSAPVTDKTPRWDHILIENLQVTGSDNSITLWGLPELPLGEITLRNATFASKNGAKIYRAPHLTLEHVTVTPEAGPAYSYWPPADARPASATP